MTDPSQPEERRFGRNMTAPIRRECETALQACRIAAERVLACGCRAALWIWVACLMLLSSALHAQQADFSGDWQTYWRTGSAVVSLEQDGTRVTGSYQPDDGRIEGTVEGHVLSGTWEQPGSSGRFVFALSEDGQVLTGRFGNGEYWNGFRDTDENGSGSWQLANGTPRETLRSLLLATNAAVYSGDAGALRSVANLVTYAGTPESAAERAQRRTLMFNILDISTLRIMDAPDLPGTGNGDTASFEVGPAGTPDKTTLEFVSDAPGQWRLVLPSVDVLSTELDRLVAALGYESLAELDLARSNSPRAVLREFVQGTNSWHEGGRERALAVMDLSAVPERLHDLDGPIYAEYLARIIDRIAFVIWQEIPDDPERSVPYIYFQHPAGNVTVARVPDPAVTGSAPQRRRTDATSVPFTQTVSCRSVAWLRPRPKCAARAATTGPRARPSA